MKGVRFNNIHSFDHLGLILTSADIPPAIPKTTFIDVAGMDGHIDASEWTGFLRYENRELTFVFSLKPSDDFWEKKRELEFLINGKMCDVELDKDIGFIYQGRCWVSEIESSAAIKQITVLMDAKPYKMERFPYKVTKSLSSGNNIISVENAQKPCVMSVTTTADSVKMTYKNATRTLQKGTKEITDIILPVGQTELIFVGSGVVTIEMQRGWL